jgi:hypothetical protein
VGKPNAERDELLSDQEIRERMLADPAVRRRIADALAQARTPSGEPGVGGRELEDLLRGET